VNESQVIVVVADGARPDTLAAAMDRGDLPAMAGLRDEGGLHSVTSTFPSVTGPAYVPFLAGRYPGPVGLPGLRWFDRARKVTSFPDYTRSYIGYQLPLINLDLEAETRTIFELCPESVGTTGFIVRGLPKRARLATRTLRYVLRAAKTHFTADLGRWLQMDRDVTAEALDRLERERPRYAFIALAGTDKASHARGHGDPVVVDALRIVDDFVGELREQAMRKGIWDSTHLWVVSDHGHSPVREHEDLARFVRGLGYRTIAHPWVYAPRPEVGVMVSGNAMAHIYVDLHRRERHWWPDLRERWNPLVDALLARDSVDIVLLPHSPDRIAVVSRDRGTAFVERAGDLLAYRTADGDPLRLGEDFAGGEDAAYEATAGTDYPDSLVQIAHLAGSPRAGEIVLSAARDWDYRARYEPMPHVSSHGALHQEHMNVPLLVNRPVRERPRRTVDVFPATLAALGIPEPARLDGRSFV
jgi:hypothetical protein